MQINPEHISALRQMGWPEDAQINAALAAAANGERVARVVGQHRSAYVVATQIDQHLRVQPPAPWTRPRVDPETRAIVGDWVILDQQEKNILGLLPRRSVLKRAAAGEHYKAQLISANIDHVLVVCGLDGDFNPRRIERYLLLVQASGAKPVLILTKADLTEHLELALESLQEIVQSGIPIFALNAKDAESLKVLHPFLGAGKTAVLVGSSGAGKSTLTNTLLGVTKMKTQAVRDNDSRGRHTTTHRVLIALPQGGCLIDTPGMRELKLSGDEDLSEGTFEDIDALATQCRFSDCGHSNEPGCAVLSALADDSLDAERFAHYLKLRDERDAAATSLAARRAEAKIANAAFNKRLKDKYGRR
jgi:ribosome biogenesis GTPase / thiamine phosphate phosphatase